MSILHVVGRSVSLLGGPRRKRFEKCARCCDFRDFDHFSSFLLGARPGAVPRYEHIYVLDRSRCLLSDFEIISESPGTIGGDWLRIQLQALGVSATDGGPGVCCIWHGDRPKSYRGCEIEGLRESEGG